MTISPVASTISSASGAACPRQTPATRSSFTPTSPTKVTPLVTTVPPRKTRSSTGQARRVEVGGPGRRRKIATEDALHVTRVQSAGGEPGAGIGERLNRRKVGPSDD